MFWFATWKTSDGADHCQRFSTPDQLWEWLGKYHAQTGEYPQQLCVFKGECVFDGG